MLEAKQSNRAWRDKVKAILTLAVEQAGCPRSLYSELMSASAATLSQYAYINWTSSALWSQSNIWCTSKIWFLYIYTWEPDLYAPCKGLYWLDVLIFLFWADDQLRYIIWSRPQHLVSWPLVSCIYLRLCRWLLYFHDAVHSDLSAIDVTIGYSLVAR